MTKLRHTALTRPLLEASPYRARAARGHPLPVVGEGFYLK